MKNIVLIGLSGCGKSTFGKRLARRLHMPLLDTDAMIEEAEGQRISTIFDERGEAYFRDLESAACLAVSELQGTIISTEGGMVLREKNMQALAKKRAHLLHRPPSFAHPAFRFSWRPPSGAG